MDQDNDSYQKTLLYFQLQSEREASGSTEQCNECEFQHRLDCTHLNAERCAKLKSAAKMDTNKNRELIETYECGHAYRDGHRIRQKVDGIKRYRPGLCIVCWNVLVWEGREIRIGKLKSAKRQVEVESEQKTKLAPKQTAKGAYRKWIRRGSMVGKVELSGENTVLF